MKNPERVTLTQKSMEQFSFHSLSLSFSLLLHSPLPFYWTWDWELLKNHSCPTWTVQHFSAHSILCFCCFCLPSSFHFDSWLSRRILSSHSTLFSFIWLFRFRLCYSVSANKTCFPHSQLRCHFEMDRKKQSSDRFSSLFIYLRLFDLSCHPMTKNLIHSPPSLSPFLL